MVELSFLGDVWLPRAFKSRVDFPGEFVFNLESPITKGAVATPGKVCLRAEKNLVAETFGRLPIAVCLANNHIMDFGTSGFADTLAELDRSGISSFGAGLLAQNCRNPLLLDIGANRIAFLGYACPTTHPIFATQTTPGVMPISLEQVAKDVRECRQRGASRIVVNLHWGMEEVHLPRIEDIRMAHQISNLGVDLIIGHHSHCIQNYEIHSRTPIFYGLGNCIFPNFSPSEVVGGYGKKQRFWNRRSIAVSYNLDSAAATPKALSFHRDCLGGGRFNPTRWRTDFADEMGSEYQRRHAKHVRLTWLRLAAFEFFSKPRFPKRKHLKVLFGKG